MVKPIYKIIVEGSDITKKLNRDITQISFIDEDGKASDEITLTLAGVFKRPKKGDEIKLYLGDEDNGLFICGLFKVSKPVSEYSADGDVLSISATAVDFSKNLKVKRSQTYENCSLKKVAEVIALRHDLGVKSDLDDIFINHLEQTNENDLHFLKRVAKEYNAIFAIKNNKVVFTKKIRDKKKNEVLPRYSFEIKEATRVRIEPTNKDEYNSVKAIWRDTKENKQLSVTVGDGEPIKIIRDSFESKADAKLKAEAALEKANSGTKVGSISCDGFEVLAGGILTLLGTVEDDGEYHITKCEHTVDFSSWKVKIEIEN